MGNKQQAMDFSVNKNVTLTTGGAISGQQVHVKRKWSQKYQIPITNLLKGNLPCSPNMRSFKSSPGRACNGLTQLRLKT